MNTTGRASHTDDNREGTEVGTVSSSAIKILTWLSSKDRRGSLASSTAMPRRCVITPRRASASRMPRFQCRTSSASFVSATVIGFGSHGQLFSTWFGRSCTSMPGLVPLQHLHCPEIQRGTSVLISSKKYSTRFWNFGSGFCAACPFA